MKVQRVRVPDCQRESWLLLDDDYRPVGSVQAFLTFLEDIDRSPNTIHMYCTHLKLFWEFLRDRDMTWSNVGVAEIADFMHWLRDPYSRITSMETRYARRSDVTINTILAAVSSFYDFQARLDTMKEVPLYRFHALSQRTYKPFLHHITKSKPVKTRLVKAKVAKHLPKTLGTDEVHRLIDTCERTRDRFLVTLLYETGMRVGQALGLRHEDIKTEDLEVHIVPRDNNPNGARAKSKGAYMVPISMDIASLYTDYVIDDLGALDSDTLPDFVFVNIWDGERGRPLTYASVYDLFRRLSKKTGIQAHPHMLRHTRATEWIRGGMQLEVVQKLLGHASVQTTEIYLNLIDSDLKAAHKKYVAATIKKRGQHEG